jgi:hypothetical protein
MCAAIWRRTASWVSSPMICTPVRSDLKACASSQQCVESIACGTPTESRTQVHRPRWCCSCAVCFARFGLCFVCVREREVQCLPRVPCALATMLVRDARRRSQVLVTCVHDLCERAHIRARVRACARVRHGLCSVPQWSCGLSDSVRQCKQAATSDLRRTLLASSHADGTTMRTEPQSDRCCGQCTPHKCGRESAPCPTR